MRKLSILLVLLFSVFVSTAQIINFPDANFKAKLLTNDIACIGNSSNTCTFGPIDVNNNGEIEVSEAAAVAVLFVSNANISDLTGIEYFLNLEILDCRFNNLTTLNISQLTNLKSLTCFQNQLSSLNLSNLSLLTSVFCRNNLLTSLDIGNLSNLEMLFCNNNSIADLNLNNNTKLKRLYCDGNLISSLDFSSNPNFFDLGCMNNPNLTSIKIRNGMTQIFGPGMYFNECWSNVPNLNYICADSNEIPALQSFLTSCGVSTSGITINSDCALGVDDYNENLFSLSPVPVKNLLTITNKLNVVMTSISIYNMLGQLVQANTNPSETIDVSGLKTGTYFIKISSDKGTASSKFVKE